MFCHIVYCIIFLTILLSHFQIIIQLQSQHLSIFKLELELLAIEVRIVLVDDTVVIGADDNDVCGVIVLRMGEIVDVVGCEQRAHRHRKGHPVIEQRPVHRLLQYESIVVIHQSYISFFLVCFLPSSYPIERLSNAYPTSICVLATTFERRRIATPLLWFCISARDDCYQLKRSF